MQRRTLIRAPTPADFRAALVERATAGGPLAARRRAVIVPTRAAAALLRETLEAAAVPGPGSACVLPDLVTRDDWMSRLHAALPDQPPLLTRLEREVLFERAAVRAAARARLGGAPFHLRPGLVGAMLDLYDELRRRQRTVRRFATALFDELRVERGTDRGSESLIHQTAFLGFAFLAYERAVAAAGSLDEHRLRDALVARRPALPFDHVVVAVADHPSDPRGLWPADFDLLGRLGAIAAIDLVMTDETHDAGFRGRIEQELPGLEEIRLDRAAPGPVLVRPPRRDADEDPPVFISRDREEELREVTRVVLERARATGGVLAESTAVVFHRPLPYLYLARQTFTDARVPFQAFDALPLAAEPWAALLDLVLAVARTAGGRDAVIALMRSRLVAFEAGDGPVEPLDVAALDAVLTERRTTGSAATFEREVEGFFGARATRAGLERDRARRAARAAATLASALDQFQTAGTAADQVRAVSAFLRRHEVAASGSGEAADRFRRARAAVLAVLDGLAEAIERHDPGPRSDEALAALIRHAVEARTFMPPRGAGGVALVDATAARFGAFDHVHIVGLVESDWPERARRSIFYTSSLLKALAWPQEVDLVRSAQAAFRDLLDLAGQTTRLHAFQLEGDAVVGPSPLVEAIGDRVSIEAPPGAAVPVFADEVLTRARAPAGLDPALEAWLALRHARGPLDQLQYRGQIEPRQPDVYRVSRIDRYGECPFKYFAETVLGLPEEREEAAGLTPLERGTLLHELFEQFYRAWQADGRGAITAAGLPDAMARFARLAADALARLPEADRLLEETRLLGSIVARGVAERVFELEAEVGRDVARRLLEFDLRGPFTFPDLGGFRQATIDIRGKADRIDVFADGSIGVVDYKLGRMPDDHAVQVAVYAHAASQALEREDGRPHPVRTAMYLAFGDDRRVEKPVGRSGLPVELAVTALAGEFAGRVARIEAGRFPADPRKPSDCQWCRYALVCRKEYRVEREATAADEATDVV